ncbi:MAG: hypothetical protein EOO65_04670 [Methanosarcinales archaeon]|nr:MAG: hypothetical protein EOO65_04670 [Methanosarcinales archaeon]
MCAHAGQTPLHSLPRPLLAGVQIAVFVRVAFIPMFYGDAHSQHWMVWMNDFVFIIFYAVFSITNGYFASLAMMKGPALVRPHERETAGLLMSVFLQGGILMGTITSFAFTGGPST